MSKLSNKEKILSQGLEVMHQQGFLGASVRDIVQAAGVPQGSFTNHFASKEAFALEILNIYFTRTTKVLEETLRNNALLPLARLRLYYDTIIHKIRECGMEKGCFIGNFSVEASEHSDLIRNRLVEIFGTVQQALIQCLKAAVQAGEIPAPVDVEALAGFMVSAMQGAILRAKVERSLRPLEQFRKMIFATITS